MNRSTLIGLTAALMLWPFAASAGTIVDIDVFSGSSGGFGFSTLHGAESACTGIDGVSFCMNGGGKDGILDGTLTGELDGLVLSNIQGDLDLVSGGVLSITDGVIDFTGPADGFASYLETNRGTFHFLTHTFAGPANSFDGTDLRIWGNNWNNVGDPDPGPSYDRLGMDLGATVSPAIPEPTAAALFGLGLIVLRGRMRTGA